VSVTVASDAPARGRGDVDGNPGATDFYMTVRQTYSDIEVHGSY